MSQKSTSHAGLISEFSTLPRTAFKHNVSRNKGGSLCLIDIIRFNVFVRRSPNFCPGNILSLSCLNDCSKAKSGLFCYHQPYRS